GRGRAGVRRRRGGLDQHARGQGTVAGPRHRAGPPGGRVRGVLAEGAPLGRARRRLRERDGRHPPVRAGRHARDGRVGLVREGPPGARVDSRAVLSEGTPAPDFTLPDQNGNPVSLDDFRGSWVAFWWFPKAFTSG